MITVYNVINKYAGKEETVAPEAVGSSQDFQKVTINYIYFKAADEINYVKLLDEVKKDPKYIEKIKASISGNSVAKKSPVSGDNFMWTDAIIKTNAVFDTKDVTIIYKCSLSVDGKDTSDNYSLYSVLENGSLSQINTAYENMTVSDIVKKIRESIQKDQRINFDYSTNFINRPYNDVDLKRVAGNVNLGGMDKKTFDVRYSSSDYRLVDLTTNQLRSPTFELIKEDNYMNKPGVPFIGTSEQIEELEKVAESVSSVTVQGKPEKIKEPKEPKESKPLQPKIPESVKVNSPDSSLSKTKADERFVQASRRYKLKIDSAIKKVKEDERGVPTYTGDSSIMQDLVRLQHKNMKIRKESAIIKRNVQNPSKIQQETGGTQQTNPTGGIEKAQKNLTEQNENINKTVTDAQKSLAEVQKDLKGANPQQIAQTSSLNKKITEFTNKLNKLKLADDSNLIENISRATDNISESLKTISKNVEKTNNLANSELEKSKRTISNIGQQGVSTTGKTMKPFGEGGWDPSKGNPNPNPSLNPGKAASVIDLFLNFYK